MGVLHENVNRGLKVIDGSPVGHTCGVIHHRTIREVRPGLDGEMVRNWVPGSEEVK